MPQLPTSLFRKIWYADATMTNRIKPQISHLLLLAVLILAGGFVLTACSVQQKTQPSIESQADGMIPEINEEVEVHPVTTEFSYLAEFDGQTALDLLKANAEVQTKEYDYGSFIVSINGVSSDSSQYWAFYVNREYAKEGADKTILKKGDAATFRLEAIKAFPTEASGT